MATVSELLTLAIEHQQMGRWQSAEELCRKVLDAYPTQVDAMNLLGVVALQTGRAQVAAEYFLRAVDLKPDVSAFHANLGAAYRATGQVEQAVASYRRALEFQPDSPEVLRTLSHALQQQGHHDEAMACYRQALAGPAALPPGTTIPNVIHFCFGFDDPPPPFQFFNYLAVKSAWWVNRPERIVLHYGNAPQGEWWDRVQEYVQLEQVEPPTQVFGRPLVHYAHKADVFRLECLLREGGIYLDLDVLCLRPFTGLLGRECVLAHQHPPDVGLCNAVILAAPKSRFLSAWYDEYHWFRSRGRDKHWVEHSVMLPRHLAKRADLRDTLKILPNTSFFFPVWTEIDRFLIDGDLRPFQQSYCVHLWETINMNLLREIRPETIQRGSSVLAQFMRPVLAAEPPSSKSGHILSSSGVASQLQRQGYFADAYSRQIWGKGSGFGSDPVNVPHYVPFLQELLRDLEIRSVVEVGCGDWQLGRCVDWNGIDYLGVDLVPDVVAQTAAAYSRPNVRFACGDALSMELPPADLLLVKDVMQHWEPEEIIAFLPRLGNYRYRLITNDVEAPELSPKWFARWHPVDLTKPPYDLKGEVRLIQYVHPCPPKVSYLFWD